MVDIGSGAKRQIADIRLSRYACYLIVQNGDRNGGGGEEIGRQAAQLPLSR